MAQFAIQHASEIVDGPTYVVHANHLIDNFNGIISDFNDRLSLITGTSQTIAGAVTFTTASTFNGGFTANGTVTLAGTVSVSGTIDLGRATDPTNPAIGTAWYNSTSNVAKIAQQVATITNATNASPIVITTAAAHNRTTGDTVSISGVVGNTAANGSWTITVTNSTTFSLNTSTGNGAYASGGVVEYNQQLATTDLLGALPTGFRSGSHPTWTSVSSVTIPSGYKCRDASDSANITVGSNLVVSLSASGALGLDTGAEASNTWYYLWLCSGASGVTAIFSASSTAPTLPTGYNQYKRRFPGAWRVNSSGNIIKSVFTGNLNFPTVYHRVVFSSTAASNPTNVINTTSSLTNVDTNSYIPPDALVGIFYHTISSGSGSSTLQPAGDSTSADTLNVQNTSGGQKDVQVTKIIPLDSSQKIDITISGTTTSVVAIRGYIVTEGS